MPQNTIYTGGRGDLRTVSNKKVAGAYLPGTFVSEGASTLTQVTSAADPGNILLLDANPYRQSGHFTDTDTLKTAYATNDLGFAHELTPNETYQAAAAAATYSFGQHLTIAASGRLAVATTGQVVVAVCRYAGAVSAGDLINIKAVAPYIKG